MTTSVSQHPLIQLCNPTQQITASPWHVICNGQPWTTATDEFRFLAMRGHLPEGQVPSDDIARIIGNFIESYLNVDGQHACITTLEKLRAFAGPQAVHPSVCPQCGTACAFCQSQFKEGRGKKASYQGVTVNLDWLGQILAAMEAEQVTISCCHIKSQRLNALRFETPDWVYIQMGMGIYDLRGILKLDEFLELAAGGK